VAERPHLVFIVGAPRSGTSWLQSELASFPGVETPPELHLFADYMRPLLNSWMHQETQMRLILAELGHNDVPSDRLIGLPTLLEKQEFLDIARMFYNSCVDKIVEARPGTRVVIEKTPSNSLVVPLIAELFPEASFIHIVRDPRDVVRSLMAISHTWGGGWAPRTAALGATMWRAHVSGGRVAERLYSGCRIRYEDLRLDPDQMTRDIWGRLGINVEVGPKKIDTGPVVSVGVDRVLQGSPVGEPSDFGKGEGRRQKLGPLDELTVETLCSRLMQYYDYPLRHKLAASCSRGVEALLGSSYDRLKVTHQEWIRLQIRHWSWRSALPRH
jgi:hypothetical protein